MRSINDAVPPERVRWVAVGNLTMLRLPDVWRMTGLGRSTIYAKMNASTFSRNVDVGGAISAWRAYAIEEWLRDPT